MADRAAKAPGKQRRAELVQAAYTLIVEKGIEGLRTREVAQRTGINSATLHYYYPDKEALIRGVVEHLMNELRTPRVATGNTTSALHQLRAEFADIRARLRESPEQVIVLTELATRARRDPAIAQLLGYLDEGWQGHLISILKAGIAEKVFRANIDVEATASAIMAQLRGLGLHGGMRSESMDKLVKHIARQTEYWVRGGITREEHWQASPCENFR